MKRRNLRTNLLSSKNVSMIGVWNIRTLYETGRTAQVAREMDTFQLDIMGLSKVRWTPSGKMTLSSGKTLLFSGPPNEENHHRNGADCCLPSKPTNVFLNGSPSMI